MYCTHIYIYIYIYTHIHIYIYIYMMYTYLKNHFHLEALRGVGGIILNAEGKRFCNELGRPGLSAIAAGAK